ncbi:MAG: hypothetical protein JSW11_12395 [Candidatus Heimdallarchaeota archaeon]|nr:MAG: hypothetical protein JSW11_12395 [Candidatus Heimdallarchaeota archaeon]
MTLFLSRMYRKDSKIADRLAKIIHNIVVGFFKVIELFQMTLGGFILPEEGYCDPHNRIVSPIT